MKEIIIRTNFNIKVGLGHFFRCKILKEKFEKKILRLLLLLTILPNQNLLKI